MVLVTPTFGLSNCNSRRSHIIKLKLPKTMQFLNWTWHGRESGHPVLIRQTWRTMKLTVILLTTAFLQVSAAGNAQEKVTLDLKNATLEKVFSEISKQTGFSFLYDDAVLQKTQRVNIKVNNASIKEVLELSFRGQLLSYVISDKSIVVRKQPQNISIVPPPVIDIKGRIVGENGEPIVGAYVGVKNSTKGTTTDNAGNFVLRGVEEDAVLEISHISIEGFEVRVNGRSDLSVLSAKTRVVSTEAVTVVANTGYQQIPLHQSTGAIDVVSSKDLNNRTASGVFSRLDGWVPGLLTDQTQNVSGNPLGISIRGRSTILSRTQPLVILDNFEYDGDLNNLNPNDVENITVLKDAAAASIYGVRAGNGVIVITTKKGKYNQEPQIEVVSNMTFQKKADIFTIPAISSAEFIEVEKTLFNSGFYAGFEANQTNLTYPFTPVIELLIAKRDGLIPAAEADSRIDALKKSDVRNDVNKYLLRNNMLQQHAINVRGGAKGYRYYFSAGYDNTLSERKGDGNDRLTIRSQGVLAITSKIEFENSLMLTKSRGWSGGNTGYEGIPVGWGYSLYPYAELVDNNGVPLPIIRSHRLAYDLNSQNRGLLDWTYNPITDLNRYSITNKNTDILINAGLQYKIFPFLKASVRYQYQTSISKNEHLSKFDSYNARNLINRYTQDAAGTLTRIIPFGGILINSSSEIRSHNIRSMLDFRHTWDKHELSGIAGNEVKELIVAADGFPYKYGYDEHTGVSVSNLNYQQSYQMYDNANQQNQIGFSEFHSALTDRFISYFGNVGYTYNNKYSLTVSARVDESNYFGVKTNQRKAPLWSAGVLWNLNEEKFYKIPWIPNLALRFSYGYSGNINKNVTAYTTANIFPSNVTGLPFALISNPPNEALRWEKVQIINSGIDFSFGKNSFLTGYFQYYHKNGIDLIGSSLLDPTSGFLSGGVPVYTGNVASMKGWGYEILLSSKNISRNFKWHTDLNFSYSMSKVTAFASSSNLGRDYLGFSQISPIVGKPLNAIFSFKSPGLDNVGDPIGYLNKTESKDYNAILNQTVLSDMVYNGPAVPPYFGNLRNTFSYKGFSVFANVSFRFGHFFKRNSISYGGLFNNWRGHNDISRRWQQAGDESFTNIPSMPDISAMSMGQIGVRDNFYLNSELLIEKADHIRFDDLSLSYELNKQQWRKLPFKSIKLGVFLNNLGIIWRANDEGIDPVYNGIAISSKRISFSLNVNF